MPPIPSIDDLIGIGYFSRLTGLSVGALRHYDSLGVLEPATVDSATGYRRYRRSQTEAGRTVALLRDLEFGLPEIAAYLAADDHGRRELLVRRRQRVRARLHALQRIDHTLLHLISPTDEGDTMTAPDDLEAAAETALAKRLYNGVWALLEKADRTPADDASMIHMAHASRHHWGNVGTPQNLAIGEWQVARVYAELGRGEPAAYHSTLCLSLTETAGVEDWCRASALESMARSLAVAGDRAGASGYRDRAVAALDAITDPEDREIIARDVESLPL